MGNLRVNPQETNMSGQTFSSTPSADAFSVAEKSTDGATGTETSYTPDFDKWHGYYRKIPEFQAVINKLASWTFGRGIIADEANKKKLKMIKGNGKDTPRGVLKNQWRVALICGDSFAEIIKDSQGRLTNLKPLNPSNINIIANASGILIRYEQFTRNPITKEKIIIHRFTLDEIYHLSYERIADENHGIPFGEKLEELILMRNEAMSDQKIVFHRYVKPIQVIQAETDDDVELAKIQATFDNAYKKTENIIIPKGVVSVVDRLAIPQYATLDPLNWLKYLVRQFVTACGMPEVIMGWGGDTTEASANIIYISFQQEVEDMQIFNEEQIEIQLNIKIELEFPVSLEQKVKDNNSKRGEGTTTNPNKNG